MWLTLNCKSKLNQIALALACIGLAGVAHAQSAQLTPPLSTTKPALTPVTQPAPATSASPSAANPATGATLAPTSATAAAPTQPVGPTAPPSAQQPAAPTLVAPAKPEPPAGADTGIPKIQYKDAPPEKEPEPAAAKKAAPAKKVAPVKKATKPATTPEKKVSFSPSMANETVVSDRDFNHFIFPGPIANGPIFPAGAPLQGKPVYLANNTQLLLQFQKNSDKPVQMVVELENGNVYKLHLKPRPVNGITHRIDGARDPKKATASNKMTGEGGDASGPRGEDIELLKHVVSTGAPVGFDPVPLTKTTRFDRFSVVPLAAWSDGMSKRVMVFNLVAHQGQTAVVAPPQFYRRGITAVMLDGDVVDANNSPSLFVVETLDDE